MKYKYKKVFYEIMDEYLFEVKRNASNYVVKVGKAKMKNFDKKAVPKYFEEPQGVKDHLRKKCSFLLIDYNRLENQLSTAFQSKGEGNMPTTDEPMVKKDGIRDFIRSIIGLRPSK